MIKHLLSFQIICHRWLDDIRLVESWECIVSCCDRCNLNVTTLPEVCFSWCSQVNAWLCLVGGNLDEEITHFRLNLSADQFFFMVDENIINAEFLLRPSSPASPWSTSKEYLPDTLVRTQTNLMGPKYWEEKQNRNDLPSWISLNTVIL